ncbi:hypothetical protein [Methyloparacoccus murrellii]
MMSTSGLFARAGLSAWVAVLTLLVGLSGCSLVQTTVDLPFRAVEAVLPGGETTEPVDPIDLQEDMLRFADNFVASTSKGVEMLQRDGKPIPRQELLTIKVTLASDVYGLATGSNALANLVGLTVFASVARWRVQDYWLPKVYGVSAEPALQSLEAREEEIWNIANRVLKPQMQAELRGAIHQWRKNVANASGQLEAFASNSLVNEVTRSSREARNSSLPSSVFALLDLDPLAGLDPATRELTETRLFAERALFIGQRMPQLIQWQMELLAMRSTSTPEVEQVIANSTQIATASDRLSRTLEQMPGLVSSEREKLVSALHAEQRGLGDLSRNFAATLAEGKQMASSTDQALKAFDDILGHLERMPSNPDSPPFEIKDYAATALEINRMALRLTETLKTFQALLNPATFENLATQAERITQTTQARSEALVDYAFRRLLILFALAAVIVVASALGYQWLLARLRGTAS